MNECVRDRDSISGPVARNEEGLWHSPGLVAAYTAEVLSLSRRKDFHVMISFCLDLSMSGFGFG